MRCPPALLGLGALLLLSACRDPTGLDFIAVSVAPERAAVKPGETVRIRVTATNHSDGVVRFSGSSTGTLWVRILDASGRPVVDLRGFTDDLERWQLEPGESAEVVWTWNATTRVGGAGTPVAPGTYRAVREMTASAMRSVQNRGARS